MHGHSWNRIERQTETFSFFQWTVKITDGDRTIDRTPFSRDCGHQIWRSESARDSRPLPNMVTLTKRGESGKMSLADYGLNLLAIGASSYLEEILKKYWRNINRSWLTCWIPAGLEALRASGGLWTLCDGAGIPFPIYRINVGSLIVSAAGIPCEAATIPSVHTQHTHLREESLGALDLYGGGWRSMRW